MRMNSAVSWNRRDERCWVPVCALVFARGVHEFAAFADRERQRLLHVDVLAVAHRLDRVERVPVVRRAHDDRIDVGTRHHLAEVVVAFGILVLVARVDLRQRGVAVRLVDVADREDPHRVQGG